MAQKLGFKAALIEGPTHFSQFASLGEAVWGERFLSEGCLSAHYRNMVMEGEKVRAFIGRAQGEDHAKIWATKRDGTGRKFSRARPPSGRRRRQPRWIYG